MSEPEMAPKVFAQSRLKLVLYLALAIGFVAVGIVIVKDKSSEAFWGWLCIAFFGLGIPVFAVLLVRPQRLSLDSDGFTISGGLRRRTWRWRWADVEGFQVMRLGRWGQVREVGFNLAPGVKQTALMRFNSQFGSQLSLPPGFRPGVEAMVDELNAYS